MITIDWAAVAKRLAFEGEADMWKRLYTDQRLPITELSERFGVSKAAVRAALLRNKVPLRTRGGWTTNPGEIPGPPDLEEQVARDGVATVAQRLELTISAVYKRIYRRRAMLAKPLADASSEPEPTQ